MPAQKQVRRKAKKPAKSAKSSRGGVAKTEREQRAFFLFLQQATDFRLALALYNDVVERGVFIRETAPKMEALGRRVLTLDLREPSEERSLLGRIERLVQTAPKGERLALMVVNLESCVDYSPELSKPGSSGTAFLETANFHRDLFPKVCPAPLVFWVTELMERAFILHAPDLWHWRSHVFDLRTRTEMRSEIVQSARTRALPSDDRRLHPEERLHRLEEELAAYRKSGDRFQEMRTLNAIGSARLDAGDARRALRDFEEVSKICRHRGDRSWEEVALGNLGNGYLSLGEPGKAIEFYEQALSIAREIGDHRGEGMTLNNLGTANSDLGEEGKAIEFYERALSIARKLGDRSSAGTALGNLGNSYGRSGEPRKAIEFYEQALSISRELGDRREEGATLGNLGNVYKTLGEPRKAIELHEQYLSTAREVGDRRGEGTALQNMANAYADLGDYEKAVRLGEESYAIHLETEDPWADRVRKAVDRWKAELQTDAAKLSAE